MTADKYQEEWLEREFIGYGFDMPDPKWPGGAKVCVSFVVQYYMGAEANVLEGDPTCCADYLEIPKVFPTAGRNENNEMMYEFGAREGVPRLLNLFKKYDVPVTWNIFTRAIEKEPYWVKPILDSGAEISCGGHRYRDNFYVDPEEEDRLVEKSIDTLQEITGDKTLPKGWLVERRSNLSTKLYSLEHAKRDLPLLYSSDSCQDDLPYWIPSPAKAGGLLMIPFSYDCTDLRFNMRGSGWASPKDYFLHLRDTFDCLYEEGEQGEPKMMTVLLHPHIIGRPNRTLWLEEFIKYVKSKSDSWIARRADIAEHWHKTHPYDPKTAFGQTPVPECGQIHIPM
ncbi:hypothetical protein BCR39DRAFT_525190 [Naematelia encephala]|uniref:NodB homology domain-containing protein n=1 Tax=Naematelia encephala TaxID=71784 RepID=A0A1Y2BB19_9TREE|nr:hypothetical protein BCR39DRAFT_525190 [Naematelia encephala]